MQEFSNAYNSTVIELNRPSMHRSVAVTFGSYFKVNIEEAGANLRAKLIDPLDADTFLFLTYRSDDEKSDKCDSEQSCRIRERLRCLQPFTKIVMERQLTTRELAEQLEAARGWSEVAASYRLSGGCVRHNSSSTCPTCFRSNTSSPYRCTGKLHEAGNCFLAPVIGRSNLNVLRQLHMQARVLQILTDYELTVRGGQPYQYVVWARLEMVWLQPHPTPFQLAPPQAPGILTAPPCVWVPLGEDYAGLNDRHAMMPRSIAPLYLGRWNVLVEGRLFDVLPCLRSAVPGHACAQTSERFLAALMVHHKLSVCRFPPTAYLQCCHGVSCYKPQCHVMQWPHSNNNNTNHGHVLLHGKYPQEVSTALIHSTALNVHGVKLSLENASWPPMGFWHDQIIRGNSLVVHLPPVGKHSRHEQNASVTTRTGWEHATKGPLRIFKGSLTWTLLTDKPGNGVPMQNAMPTRHPRDGDAHRSGDDEHDEQRGRLRAHYDAHVDPIGPRCAAEEQLGSNYTHSQNRHHESDPHHEHKAVASNRLSQPSLDASRDAPREHLSLFEFAVWAHGLPPGTVLSRHLARDR